MDRKYTAIIAAAILVIAVAGHFIYQYFNRTETVQPMTQEQVEQPAEVQKAASKAGVKLDVEQSSQISRQITKYIEEDAEPEYTIATSKSNYQKAAENAQKTAGADYSIIVEKDKGKLKEASSEAPVVLNQYNVKAYKSVIRSAEYAPSTQTAGFVIQKRITNSGVYAGVGIEHSFKENTTMAKVVVSW